MREWQEDQTLYELVESTRRSLPHPGGRDLPAIFEAPDGAADAVWVSAMGDVSDRVSTARRTGGWVGLGLDSVAKLVNQVWARGAVPTALHATLVLMSPEAEVREQLVLGISRSCRADSVAMSGLQTIATGSAGDDHDLSLVLLGTSTRSSILDGSQVRSGDLLVGLASQGLHGDGHLAAWAIADAQGWGPDYQVPGTDAALATLMNARHRTYLGSVQRALKEQWLHALVPVGCGGLTGSLSRWLPASTGFDLNHDWDLPPLQLALQHASGMSREQFSCEFNCGVGMVAVVPSERVPGFLEWIQLWNEGAWVLGRVA